MEAGGFLVAVAGFRRLTFTCRWCMIREGRKGDGKLHCWHPFEVPEHCFRETEAGSVLPREEETTNLSIAWAVVLLFGGHGSRPKFLVTLPVLLVCSDAQLTFQARVTDVTHV